MGFKTLPSYNEIAYHCFEMAHLKNHQRFQGNSSLPDDFEFLMEDLEDEWKN